MQPSAASDIFFTLGSIFLVIVIILLVLFFVYAMRVIRALRGVRGTVSRAKIGTLLLRPGIFGKGMVATAVIRRLLSFFWRRRTRRR